MESSPAGALWFDPTARLNVASLRHDEEGQSVRGIRRLSANGLDWPWTGSAGTISFADAPFDVLFQDPFSENVLLAHPVGVNTYARSVDGGETWERATKGTWGGGGGLGALPKIVGDPLRLGTYYMTDELIRRSDDFGETWARIGPLEDARLFDTTRAAGLLLGPDPGVLLTAYRDSVWRSEDDGATWRVIGRVEPGGVALDLARHRSRPERLFTLTLRGCFVSDDGGHRWRKALSPLSGFWMSAHFREDPEDDDVLYIVANRELHRTTDAGATWTSHGDQLPGMPWIHDLAVDPVDPSGVYLATTAGVFRIGGAALPTAVVGEAVVQSRDPLLRQNYPNPFNPSTVIEYLLPEAVEVQLKIYALTGQRVRVLVSEEQPAGRYRTVWDGRNSEAHPVASGLYFSRLRAGRSTRVTKMLLIR